MQKVALVDRDGTIIWEPERPERVDPRETFPLVSADNLTGFGCFLAVHDWFNFASLSVSAVIERILMSA